jgi:hypothetical protein
MAQRKALLLLGSLGPLAQLQLPALEPLRQHPDRGIASLAMDAIARIERASGQTPPEILSQLTGGSVGYLEKGLYQVELRGDLAAEFVPDGQRLLDHGSQSVQIRAIRALVRMGPHAVEALDALDARCEDARADVRQNAARALLAIQTPHGARPDLTTEDRSPAGTDASHPRQPKTPIDTAQRVGSVERMQTGFEFSLVGIGLKAVFSGWGPAPKPPGFCALGPITGAPTIGSETTEEAAPARQFDNAGAPVIGIAAALELLPSSALSSDTMLSV